MAQTVDLRQLVMAIDKQKELNAGLALEYDCVIEIEDPKELIKVLNYLINYCIQLTDQKLNIALNDQMDEFLLVLNVNTTATEIPPISDQLVSVLKTMDANLKIKHEPGKYLQVIIVFY
jgi:hypothetical protein